MCGLAISRAVAVAHFAWPEDIVVGGSHDWEESVTLLAGVKFILDDKGATITNSRVARFRVLGLGFLSVWLIYFDVVLL